MDLAVGVIIGAAFQAIVNSLVNDLISPIIGLFANTDFSALVFMIGDVEIRYGAFITAVINFVIMALVIFLFVKALNRLTSLGKKEGRRKRPPPSPPRNAPIAAPKSASKRYAARTVPPCSPQSRNRTAALHP